MEGSIGNPNAWKLNKVRLLRQVLERCLAGAQVRFETGYVWLCSVTTMTPKLHFQKPIFYFWTTWLHPAIIFHLSQYILRISEEICGERIPVLLVLQNWRIKVLTDHMHVQLLHRGNLKQYKMFSEPL